MPKPWSREELEVLEALAKRSVPIDRIQTAIPARTKEAIRQMMVKRGLWKNYVSLPDMEAYKQLLRIYKG